MGIKKMFKELKKDFHREYYFCNGEETLIWWRENLKLEIFYINYHLDLVVTYNDSRDNYINSLFFSYEQKARIAAAINAVTSLKSQCETITQIILENTALFKS